MKRALPIAAGPVFTFGDTMLAAHRDADTGIIEIIVDGPASSEEVTRVTQLIGDAIKTDGQVRLLKVIEEVGGIEPTALWQNFQFSFQHMNDVSRVAIVSDANWIEWWSKTTGTFFSGKVRIFSSDQIDEARTWLDSE